MYPYQSKTEQSTGRLPTVMLTDDRITKYYLKSKHKSSECVCVNLWKKTHININDVNLVEDEYVRYHDAIDHNEWPDN